MKLSAEFYKWPLCGGVRKVRGPSAANFSASLFPCCIPYIDLTCMWSDSSFIFFLSVEFSKKPVEGAVCLFTLKNPSYPEYIRHTESAAMTVATHPNLAYLIVVGMYDGNVAVYNTHASDPLPQYQSNSVNNKHWGIVWQVGHGHGNMPG